MRALFFLATLICALTFLTPGFTVPAAQAETAAVSTNAPPPPAPLVKVGNPIIGGVAKTNAPGILLNNPPSPGYQPIAGRPGAPYGPPMPPRQGPASQQPPPANVIPPPARLQPPRPFSAAAQPPQAAPSPAQQAAQSDQGQAEDNTSVGAVPPPPGAHKQSVGVIDFQGTPVQAVLEYYATQLAKRSIIAAPNLSGQIYFRSQTDLTIEEAMQALESVLAINGIAVVPMGDKFLKVVQIATAKQEGVPYEGKVHEMPAADVLSTQIIPLQYSEAADVVSALQPYMHPYGQLLALPKANAILITETAANVNQMLEILKALDVPSALRMETKIYDLSHAKSADVMARLQSIIQEAQQIGAGGGGSAQPTTPSPVRFPRPGASGGQPAAGAGESSSLVEGKVIMTADERTNKLFILARPSNFAFFDRIIAELDAKVEPDVVIKVIQLQYATAEDAASLVNALISGGSVSSSSSTRKSSSSSSSSSRTGTAAAPPPPPPSVGGGGGGGSAQNSGFLQYQEGVRILPDPRTNSLLIMATKEDMARLEELIRSVDTSVAQVQIEVVIAEVTLNNELDVGVDFFKNLFTYRSISQAGGNSTDGNVPVTISGVGGSLASNVTAAALASGAGGLTWFTTFRNLSLDTVVHALASTSNSKVLSTPVIQTMDNQEADILVGESVPVPVSTQSSIVTSSGTEVNNGVGLNSNIEYKDVAIELTVTPRINPDGYVRMDIEQKVNDLGANVNISGTSVPTILKREAKSSVAVQDQSTIVLGGLIKEQKTVTTTKTPFLGDIPFFGQVFKSQQNNKQRTELIIFIRPTVMRTDKEAVAEARRRARMLRAGQELDLEKHFEHNMTNNPGNADEPRVDPQSMNQQPNTVAPSSMTESVEGQKQAAKIRALEEQSNQSN